MKTILTRRVQCLDYHDPCAMMDVYHDKPYTIFFDSSDKNHPDARYSFIAFDPIQTFETYIDKTTTPPFGAAQNMLDAYTIDKAASDPRPPVPFCGGIAGVFGYDIARTLETLPSDNAAAFTLPDCACGLYLNVVAYDHVGKKCWYISYTINDASPPHAISVPAPHEGGLGGGKAQQNNPQPNWTSNFTRAAYVRAVTGVMDYIRAGDIFQANIAQNFTAPMPDNFCAYAQYLKLRKTNPAPFAGFMRLDNNAAILSSSPEQFLRVESGHVTTKPIKGTLARKKHRAADKIQSDTLRNDIKNRAENTMIVDLLRNDLSKTCTAQSVHVDKLCEIESFAGLHHLVSTVSGTLKPDQSALDTLQACFPGGSITGAPKIRAMQIIEQLEDIRRHAYCGSLAYVDFNGDMDSNILIRTVITANNELSLSVGGGITLGSDPADEYDETLVKAARIFKSFEQY